MHQRANRRQGGMRQSSDAETGLMNNGGHSHSEMSFLLLLYCCRGIDSICRAQCQGVATFLSMLRESGGCVGEFGDLLIVVWAFSSALK